ncbi:hypothetical protein AWB80_00986 [Caballeronia pedi]|uniref:Uncharacterized protein n=1 Tax=Caballeronia pedi TaxID=1777141 RepID=A0A157ZK90_9BURK|nr:DUF1493 family protein [Caballeronia pedi]SAK45962.1 hypothetical protein AWB80_00986 [Caballeronia pedi]
MTQQPAVSGELEKFLREHIGLWQKRLVAPADEIENDYGVTSDGADGFMVAFCERFNVNPGDYLFQRYFEMEGFRGPLFSSPTGC